MLETSLGELVIDLEVDRCPKTCENFLKLCKIKYYALNAFFNGQSCALPDTREYSSQNVPQSRRISSLKPEIRLRRAQEENRSTPIFTL